MVSKAPRRGWTAARGCQEGGRLWLFPPGGPLDQSRGRPLEAAAFHWAVDGRSLVYVEKNRSRTRRYLLDSGRDQILTPCYDTLSLALSPDGNTLYTAETVGQVRRTMITNFGDRPRPEAPPWLAGP
jgi:sugar lactone lactonase YvrE